MKKVNGPLRMKLNLFGTDGSDSNGGTDVQTDPETDIQTEKNDINGKTFTRDDVAKMIAAETAKVAAQAQEAFEAKQKEADKLAQMNAEEKAQHEKAQLESRIAEFERKEQLADMTNEANEMLTEKGVTPTKEVLSMIVSEDAEVTSKNVSAYIAAIESERELIKADFEKRLGGKIPLEGGLASVLTRGAQLAQKANEQNKKPENDPWAQK